MPSDAAAERRKLDSTDVRPSGPELDISLDLLEIVSPLFDRLAEVEPLPPVQSVRLAAGEAAWISVKSPGKTGPNEDAVAAIGTGPVGGLLLVADGLGGHRGGRRASQLLRTSLTKTAKKLRTPRQPPPIVLSGALEVPGRYNAVESADHRGAILDDIERVNQRLLRSRLGSGTTLALVELEQDRVRSYHVGDSEILVVSQRGRVKYATVSHSPVGYAVESGMMTEEEAIQHPDRHLVSNVVGSPLMSVELGPWITLSARDTVLLASDGLFDNLLQSEIIAGIRKGPLRDGVTNLARLARQRMLTPDPDRPSKPDDLTILAYRGTGRGRNSR